MTEVAIKRELMMMKTLPNNGVNDDDPIFLQYPRPSLVA